MGFNLVPRFFLTDPRNEADSNPGHYPYVMHLLGERTKDSRHIVEQAHKILEVTSDGWYPPSKGVGEDNIQGF